jgi:CRISPR-associated endonuclease Cas1
MTNPLTASMMEAWSDVTPDPGTYRTQGIHHRIHVRDNELIIIDQVREDGDGWQVREREKRFSKLGTDRLHHLTITGTAGSFSSEARRWLSEANATWIHLDNSGATVQTLGTSGGILNPHLVRAQAMCGEGLPNADTGMRIVRRFLTRKMEGQRWNAEHLLQDEVAAKEIGEQIDLMQVSTTQEKMRGYEGNAAKIQWNAWKDMPVYWRGPKPTRAHWLKFPGRKTLVPVQDPKNGEEHTRETNRGATDPVNAMLNSAYHAAEMECTIALMAAGLLPELGMSHADKKDRASFALDLIEVMRPGIDEMILGLVNKGLVKSNFIHDRVTDKVRLKDDFFREITARVHVLAACLTPHVAETVQLLREVG